MTRRAIAAAMATLRHLPRGVIALGMVSLCMDLSSEMIHSLLPVFLVDVLGAGALTVGLVEGIAEATAAVTKAASGGLSDWVGRRKPLILLGYGLSTLSKPAFALAGSVPTVLAARFFDRVGKGIRGAPRDALVTELTPADSRGAAFGLRQALDTVGAVGGPLIALLVMALSGGRFRLVFGLAILPALAAVAIILAGVPESPSPPPRPDRDRTRSPAMSTPMGKPFWRVVGLGTVLTLARFSEAFLLLRAQDAGLGPSYVPLMLIVMNVVYAIAAYPFGLLADRVDRRRLMAWGTGLLILADIVLAWASTVAAVLAGAMLWGLHLAATQGLLSALVGDAAPAARRGTAFGLFNLISGLALLAASPLAGLLWNRWGPAAPFLAGGVIASAALAGLLLPQAPSS